MGELNAKIELSEELKVHIDATLEKAQAIIDENKELGDKILKYEKALNDMIQDGCGGMDCKGYDTCDECSSAWAKGVLLSEPQTATTCP